MNFYLRAKRAAVLSAALMAALLPAAAVAQTKVSLPKNKYNVQDDVKIGREAAAQVERQFPMVNDRDSQAYIERVGANLVAAIPREFRQPAFDYRFTIVNASDINAFAVPGGPMYVNRGMIEGARNEGEMAGVMAHEISHIALRHSTAQATKQGSVGSQLGMLGMILGGAILGGQTGAQIGMLGAQAWMTKYSREYETQADFLGARIMADAGYDPRDLANMFQTIAQQGGGRAPEWLSSHPDPGNRFQRINQEATRLNVSQNPIKITRDFERIQARLRSMPPARTMAEIQRQSSGGSTQGPAASGQYSRSVPTPSGSLRPYNNGELYIGVPSNWRDVSAQNTLIFAPDGAYGNQGITHGAMIGVHRSNSRNVLDATREYLNGVVQANPYLQQRSQLSRAQVAQRQGYSVELAGRSPVTNRTEVVAIYTVPLRTGDLLYIAAVVPEDEAFRYSNTFRNMIRSLRLNE
ncbi:MAG TPA: M48 family metallopeptidase [Pyrinomonadaceae bacterium]|nr:M48 family metallopeptidase [Pyrinomonadaceae bacterium]